MIKIVLISFYEPYTGIHVEGTKPMFFRNENDFNNWVGKTYVALIEKYGYGVYVGEVKE